MQQVPYQGFTNMRGHCSKFSRHGDLATRRLCIAFILVTSQFDCSGVAPDLSWMVPRLILCRASDYPDLSCAWFFSAPGKRGAST